MKNYRLLAIGMIFILALFYFQACGSKKSSKKTSFPYVNNYQAEYTEAKGTKYTGDFYPIAPGKEWRYTGSMTGSDRITLKGKENGMPIDTTFTEYYNSNYVQAISHILAPVTATLSQKTYTLLPEEGYADIDLGYTSTNSYPETMRYYEKTPAIVYIRAVPDGEGGFIEVKDPVFIKSELVVGDSWISQPTMNTTQLAGSEDVNMKALCKLFVIGKDSLKVTQYIPVPPFYLERIIEAVRVDEVAEITGSVSAVGTTMKLDAKLKANLLFADSVGVVASSEHAEITLKGGDSTLQLELYIIADLDLFLSSTSESVQLQKLEASNYIKETKIPEKYNHIIERTINTMRLISVY